ncbi:MAG: triacylglycerol lipase [Planctomycetota bacterium]|jgi:triacylglycerol lipase
MIATKHCEVSLDVRVGAFLCILDPGPEIPQGNFVLCFTGNCTGVTADAFALIYYKSISHDQKVRTGDQLVNGSQNVLPRISKICESNGPESPKSGQWPLAWRSKLPKKMPSQLADLKIPNLKWDYLAKSEHYPFQHGFDGQSLINAWWLMEISFLSYVQDREFVNRFLKRAGFDGALSISRDSNHVLVVRDETKLIVCFRGTQIRSFDNLLTDAKFAWADFDGKGKAHRGFVQALDSLWDDLEKELTARSRGREIWFTGHSLGGALGALAAARWGQPSRIYTFGAPRIGDKALREGFPAFPFYRFVNDHDVISQLPPPLGYRHIGNLCHLRRDGRMEDGTRSWDLLKDNLTDRLPGLIKQLRSKKGAWESLLGNNSFSDHCPLSYAVRLWNFIERPASS